MLIELHASVVRNDGALLSIQLFFNGRRTRAERTDGTQSSCAVGSTRALVKVEGVSCFLITAYMYIRKHKNVSKRIN
jgi:hypothetical protein